MKHLLTLLFLSSLCLTAAAQGVRSGKASAQWLVPGKPLEAGLSFKTVIRLNVDDHWHVYWLNPGEAGMATSAEMVLPDGWKSSDLLHPIPKTFETGGLHGFGHEGTVDYPLEIFVPEDFKGDAEFVAKVSWLTCDDNACVPGEADLKLKVVDGKPVAATEDAAACATAYGNLPVQAAENVKLTFEDGKDHWKLSLANIGAYKLDPDKTTVFVATSDLVPASAKLKFEKKGERWVGEFPKSEYAPKKPKECAVLLVQAGKGAVHVEWQAK